MKSLIIFSAFVLSLASGALLEADEYGCVIPRDPERESDIYAFLRASSDGNVEQLRKTMDEIEFTIDTTAAPVVRGYTVLKNKRPVRCCYAGTVAISALKKAIKKNQLDAVKVLLSMEECRNYGEHALLIAIAMKHYGIIEFLSANLGYLPEDMAHYVFYPSVGSVQTAKAILKGLPDSEVIKALAKNLEDMSERQAKKLGSLGLFTDEQLDAVHELVMKEHAHEEAVKRDVELDEFIEAAALGKVKYVTDNVHQLCKLEPASARPIVEEFQEEQGVSDEVWAISLAMGNLSEECWKKMACIFSNNVIEMAQDLSFIITRSKQKDTADLAAKTSGSVSKPLSPKKTKTLDDSLEGLGSLAVIEA